jgi:group I intron endonuclease
MNLTLPLDIKRDYSTTTNSSVSLVIQRNMESFNLKPYSIYEDIHLESVQQNIRTDLKGLSGIYMIFNKITEEYYIGSGITDKLYSRFYKHLLHLSGNKCVKNAVIKYGKENFAFIIVEIYPKIINRYTNNELIELEQQYLNLLTPTYNILTEAGNSFGYKHLDISREKMRNSFTDERRKFIGDLNRGKSLSPEVIAKLKQAALNREPMSVETRLKCISNNKPVILLNKNDTIFGRFFSIKDAANAISCNEKTIRRALKTDSKLVKRT